MKKLLGMKKIILSIGGLATTIGAATSLVAYKKTDIKEISSNQDLVKKVVKGDLKNLPKGDETILPSSIGKPSDGVTASGVAYTFSTWAPDDVWGSITWIATLSKGKAITTLKGIILNYLDARTKMNQELLKTVVISDLNLPKGNNSVLASSVANPSSTTFSGVPYVFYTWVANDEKGTIDWVATLIREGETRLLKGTIDGYLIDYDKINQKLVKATTKQDLPLPKANANALPWSIKPSDGVTNSGVSYTFNTWTPNDYSGSITWVATLTKGKVTTILKGNIIGYSNIGDKFDQYLVNAVHKSDLNLPSGDKTILSSTITKPSGGLTASGVAYTFNTWTSNDSVGTIDWVATLTKYKTTTTIKGTIFGYLIAKK